MHRKLLVLAATVLGCFLITGTAHANPWHGHDSPHTFGGGPGPWQPVLVLGLDGGVGGLTGEAHNATWAGPMWGARVGIAFTSWFGIEARYVGMWNAGNTDNVAHGVGLVSTDAFTDVRFTIPLRYVQPYFYTGIGGMISTVTGSPANQQAVTLRQSTAGDVPFGAGVDLCLGHHWGLGFETTYHVLFGENFATSQALNNGDMWTVGTVVHVAL